MCTPGCSCVVALSRSPPSARTHPWAPRMPTTNHHQQSRARSHSRSPAASSSSPSYSLRLLLLRRRPRHACAWSLTMRSFHRETCRSPRRARVQASLTVAGVTSVAVWHGLRSAVRSHHVIPQHPPMMTRMATETVTVSPGESPSSASAPASSAAAGRGGLGQPLCMNAQSHERVWWLSSQERVACFQTHGRYTLSWEKKAAWHCAALSYCVAHSRLKRLLRSRRSPQVSFAFSDGSSRRSQRQSGFDTAFTQRAAQKRE